MSHTAAIAAATIEAAVAGMATSEALTVVLVAPSDPEVVRDLQKLLMDRTDTKVWSSVQPAQTQGPVIVARADLIQIREALVTEVIHAPQGAVEEINTAIALADLLLDLDSPMTRDGVTLESVRRPTVLTMAQPRTVVDAHG